jgi:hypothetical protein
MFVEELVMNLPRTTEFLISSKNILSIYQGKNTNIASDKGGGVHINKLIPRIDVHINNQNNNDMDRSSYTDTEDRGSYQKPEHRLYRG